jgi:hypothetical protein
MPRLKQLVEVTREKAQLLGLTARQVERAIYAQACLTKTPKKTNDEKKRKRR